MRRSDPRYWPCAMTDLAELAQRCEAATAGRFSPHEANRIRWERHHADPSVWFWGRVAITSDPSDCWLWTGRVGQKRRGYGRLVFNGKQTPAHRMALILSKGEPPDASLFACHSCDNPPCCNPSHLWWGTHLDNMRDCCTKGRKRGAHRRIPTQECVELRSAGWLYSQLADRYGVTESSVGRCLNRAALRARAEG